ncbi:hypothetical protein ACFRNT_17675 [Streptomyces sp. NPDC056697]|uniref:hypothetical protein n=1 Tax=Streptomyces sp. NPDC056697 TaxID=3345915 RepID=UPI0036C5581B
MGRRTVQHLTGTRSYSSCDAKSSYVDTTGWLASDDLSDSVHPNDKGHRTITDRLAPVISAKLQA